MEHCSTCGREITAEQIHSSIETPGRRCLFCCQTCRSVFEASSLQRGMVSESFRSRSVAVSIEYLPALALGGDYAYARLASDTELYLLVGDVSGHGVGPSLVMSRISAAVERLVRERWEPSAIVRHLDLIIESMTSRDTHYVTLFVGVIRLDTQRIRYLNCGHPAPLLWSERRGEFTSLKSQRVPVGLSFLTDTDVEIAEVEWSRGDKLILFTDGLSETEVADGSELGEAGVRELVRGFVESPSGDGVERTFSRLRDLQTESSDDILMVLVDFFGSALRTDTGIES